MSENKNNEFFFFFFKKENQQGSSLSTPASKTLPRQNGPTFSQVKRLENPDVGTCFCFLDGRCRYLKQYLSYENLPGVERSMSLYPQPQAPPTHLVQHTFTFTRKKKEISWRRNQPCHRPEQIPTANRRSSRAAWRSIPYNFLDPSR